jgi:hypothetical protein
MSERHVSIIGSSIARLAAARVLSDHFIPARLPLHDRSSSDSHLRINFKQL